MALLTICDEVFGVAKAPREIAHELRLDISQISAADLIRLRVEREYEAQAPQPVINGTDLKAGFSRRLPASLEQAIAEAQRGLASNAFFLIVNGRQVRGLDEIIPLEAVNAATFLKLVPLKGGVKMFGIFRQATTVPDYTALFDYDEARLAAGTGSDLLDAFLRVPVETRNLRYWIDSVAEGQAILNSDPATRGDIFARLCALCYGRDGVSERKVLLPENHESLVSLKALLDRETMRLPSASVLTLLELQEEDEKGLRLASRGYGYKSSIAVEALTFLKFGLAAEEKRPDPDFVALVRKAVDRFEQDFSGYNPREFYRALPLYTACQSYLGRDAAQSTPVLAFARAREAAEALLVRWQAELPDLLWRYLSLAGWAGGRQDPAGQRAVHAEALDLPPPARGALLSQIWALTEDWNRKPPGLPWSHRQALVWNEEALKFRIFGAENAVCSTLWKDLLARPCLFPSSFALELLYGNLRLHWCEHAVFARSLAASLPRTQAARDAVEHHMGERIARSLHSANKRALEKQRTILRDAFAAEATALTQDAKAAKARAAFEAALAEAREKLAAAQKRDALWGHSTAARALAAISRLTSRHPERVETRLGGYRGPLPLLTLAVTAFKLGPIPAHWPALLQEIQDDVIRTWRETGLPVGSDAEAIASGAQPLPGDLRYLNATRAVLALFEALDPAERSAFDAAEDLAAHAPSGAAPSAKWAKAALALAQGPQAGALRRLLLTLLSEPFDAAAPVLSHDPPLRRALAWQLAFHPEVARPLGELALRALAPSPQGGISNELLGNAALWSLANLPNAAGLPVLARTAARTRYPKVRQRINVLFEQAAQKAGRPRAEIEEDIAPEHGFEAGIARFELGGGGGAEIGLSSRGKAEIVWRNEAGKVVKSPTAAMKLADAAGLKAVKEAAKEIELDYAVQAKRVEKLYRSTRALDCARWRSAYVEHPFVGQIARRLIWRAGDVAGLWRDGGFEDVAGVKHEIADAKLTLWHPVEASEAEVLAWRERLQALGIDQPFRQAWRETYRVTDAERATGHYSNRFAGHILRQHQMLTLARLNDWTCRHRMWQDVANDEPTCVAFPDYGVYAEYWTAGAGGDDPPVAESTAYLYLTTDRVAFHRLTPEGKRGERLGVEDVPQRVYSEILRGCDLFVSVASIARDAQWLDRGRDAEHPNQWLRQADAYWREASQAPLPASAEIRRELLARLLPALGLGDRLRLDDRRLQVRGVKGEYAIHLGSGAAFHASGRHICIVPAGAAKTIALPFEGDESLALILSKAMLLLHDDEIADPVILAQI